MKGGVSNRGTSTASRQTLHVGEIYTSTSQQVQIEQNSTLGVRFVTFNSLACSVVQQVFHQSLFTTVVSYVMYLYGV